MSPGFALKALITADIHISTVRSLTRDLLIERYTHLFNELLRVYKENSCDYMLILGDVFDRNKPNPDEISLFFDLLNILENNKIKTYITNGNHEATTKTASYLDPFESLKYKYITVISRESLQVSPSDGITWLFWPYSYIKNQRDIREVPLDDNKNYLFSHARGGSETFHVSEEYPFDWFKQANLRTVFLGDIHFGHWVQPGTTVYPGAPLEIKYGSNVTNSVIVYDFDNDDCEFFKLDSIPLCVERLDITEISEEFVASFKLSGHTKFVISGSREELDTRAVEIGEMFDDLNEHTPFYISVLYVPNKLDVDLVARFDFTRAEEGDEQSYVEVLSLEELDLYLDYIQASQEERELITSEYLELVPRV